MNPRPTYIEPHEDFPWHLIDGHTEEATSSRAADALLAIITWTVSGNRRGVVGRLAALAVLVRGQEAMEWCAVRHVSPDLLERRRREFLRRYGNLL